MDYQEALDWLLSCPKMSLENGVERVKWLLAQVGHPEKQTPVVHFVGTNGKGSTLNALASILMVAGYSVGRFTSPSILHYREQIVCQEEMISEEDFAQIIRDLQPIVKRLPLETGLGAASEFEVLVVVFFIYFSQYRQVDILLVEAGMGGLLDATNVLEPLALVCPSIGLDHQAFLGDSYVEIATQKIGALQAGVPLVYTKDRQDVTRVFEKRAAELSCPTYALGRDFEILEEENAFSYRADGLVLEHLALGMKGRHQYANASLAIQTALLLREHFPKLDQTAIRKGLRRAVWPGRIELVQENLILDGAHNNESIAVLCRFLQEEYAQREIHILFAAINTKPVDDMLAQLSQLGQVTVTSFDDERAVSLTAYPAEYPRVADFREWLAAVDKKSERLYVVTGSLYFISQVRPYLLEESIDGIGSS